MRQLRLFRSVLGVPSFGFRTFTFLAGLNITSEAPMSIAN
jgi:hypothetical protein